MGNWDLYPTGGGAGGAGATGASFLSGAGAPASGTGANGDSYLNTTTGDVYGPKTAGAWGSPTGNIKGATGAAGPTLSPVQLPVWFTDFLGTASSLTAPFVPTAIATGTTAMGTPLPLHPGVVRITSSTTANSGYRIVSDPSSIRMSNGDICEIGFSLVTATNTLLRLGFLDTTDQTDVTDGVYLEVNGTTASFKSANSTTRTTATNTATITAGTWYRAKVEMVSATEADVTLFDDTGATVLAMQAITTNLPTGVSRQTGVGVVATNSGTTAVALVDLDYIAYSRRVGTELTR